jgi:hypothetical protein
MSKKLLFFLIIFLSSFYFKDVSAYQFPNDAQYLHYSNISYSATSGTVFTVPEGHTWTILQTCLYQPLAGISYLTENQLNNHLVDNYPASTQCIPMSMYLSSGKTVSFVKPANFYISVSIVYVDYDLHTLLSEQEYLFNISEQLPFGNRDDFLDYYNSQNQLFLFISCIIIFLLTFFIIKSFFD